MTPLAISASVSPSRGTDISKGSHSKSAGVTSSLQSSADNRSRLLLLLKRICAPFFLGGSVYFSPKKQSDDRNRTLLAKKISDWMTAPLTSTRPNFFLSCFFFFFRVLI